MDAWEPRSPSCEPPREVSYVDDPLNSAEAMDATEFDESKRSLVEFTWWSCVV